MPETKDQLVMDIGKRIAEDALKRSEDLTSLVMIAQGQEGTLDITTFIYFNDGRLTRDAPRDLKAALKIRELRKLMAESDGKELPWKACLMRFDAESGKIDFDFEYDDPNRWAFTDKDWRVRAEELRAKH